MLAQAIRCLAVGEMQLLVQPKLAELLSGQLEGTFDTDPFRSLTRCLSM